MHVLHRTFSLQNIIFHTKSFKVYFPPLASLAAVLTVLVLSYSGKIQLLVIVGFCAHSVAGEDSLHGTF